MFKVIIKDQATNEEVVNKFRTKREAVDFMKLVNRVERNKYLMTLVKPKGKKAIYIYC